MDLMPLLDELQTMARNGLEYATNPYDRERYERLLDLVSAYYGQTLDMPPAEVRARFRAELGYITPKVGADAAIFNEAGQILLVQRTDDQCWCLPCGWIDPNESPAEAAVRETREETGLAVRVRQLVDVFTRKPNSGYGPHTSIAVVYLCDLIGGTLQISHESLDARYWLIDHVPAWHASHQQYAIAAYALWQQQRAERSESIK